MKNKPKKLSRQEIIVKWCDAARDFVGKKNESTKHEDFADFVFVTLETGLGLFRRDSQNYQNAHVLMLAWELINATTALAMTPNAKTRPGMSVTEIIKAARDAASGSDIETEIARYAAVNRKLLLDPLYEGFVLSVNRLITAISKVTEISPYASPDCPSREEIHLTIEMRRSGPHLH